ncbi:Transposable element tcb1 transposase, partial [Caligus rogercresseyi]
NNKADRVSKGPRDLERHEEQGTLLGFYSDEKIFTVGRVRKPPKRPLDLPGPKEVKSHSSKKPAAVMTLTVISSEGDVMVPHFFQVNETVNKTVYLDVLKRVVEPWMKEDGWRAQNTRVSMTANTAHFWPPTFWPANSPDLNPCDFYL